MKKLQICGKCEYMIYLPKEEESFKCEKCKHEECLKCGDKPHKGSTCEQFRKWKEENNQADKLTNEMAKKEGLKNCPECGALSQKIDGCNYMTCQSAQCRSKTFFCYICGSKLTKQEHYNHFTKGPFEYKCVNKP